MSVTLWAEPSLIFYGVKEGKETRQKSCSCFVALLSKNLDNKMHKSGLKPVFYARVWIKTCI